MALPYMGFIRPQKVIRQKLTFTLHSWALKVGLSIAGLEASFTGAVIAVRGVSAGGISRTCGSVFTLVHT